MNKVRRLFSQLPHLFLWLFISVFFCGWIFTLITDTSPEKKITVFVDEQKGRFTELAAELEEALPGNLKMVKAHPFSYAMLDGDQLRAADIFIVRASDVDTYREWFTGGEGIPVNGAAGTYIEYTENCLLFYGALSKHVAGNPGAVDDAAKIIAEKFLTLQP